eukprot:scaffold13305_cov51-Phaeocystis_antarctica.AAC.1
MRRASLRSSLSRAAERVAPLIISGSCSEQAALCAVSLNGNPAVARGGGVAKEVAASFWAPRPPPPWGGGGGECRAFRTVAGCGLGPDYRRWCALGGVYSLAALDLFTA